MSRLLGPVLAGLLGSGGCARVASPPAGAALRGEGRAAPELPLVPGDAIAYRFTDHVKEAGVESSASLARAFRALDYPAKLVDPYSGLGGEAAYRLVELALADADVADYGRPHERARAAPLPFDPVWNRTRAVYESKRSLFSLDTRYRFAVPATHQAELTLSLATPPRGAPVQFTIEIDGVPALRRSVADKEAGGWIAVALPLAAGAHQVTLETSGRAPGFWGNPLVVDRCRACALDAGAVQRAADLHETPLRPRYNLLFVIIDTLRADALPVMPSLRRLASEGAHFTQAITAATWTRPSVLAMFGGDLPTRLGQGAEEMIPSDRARREFYATAPPLLPRALAAAGYRSVAIGNNFFLLGYPQIGLSLGFDEVADIRHPVLDTPAISRAALAFMAAHRDEPWFLEVHYDAPHWPYTPPPEYLAKLPRTRFPDDPLARAYLAEAAYADDHLGQLLFGLDRLGLAARTLVVVLGDHGEVFDHAHAHTVEALRQPTLHHHGWAGYDELLHVPLVLRLPGAIAPARLGAQVSLIDLEPTVRELLGVAARADARGRSLMPLLHGVALPERPAFVEGQNVRVVRAGGWSYLRRADGRLTLAGGQRVVRREELYDLVHDPEQHDDRAARDPEALARMRALFDAEAPTPRVVPVAPLHLRLAPDRHPHVVAGTLRSNGTLWLRGMSGAEAAPLDARTLSLTLRGDASVDFALDPPDATLELELTRDGAPVAPADLLLGEMALPLVAEHERLQLSAEELAWAEARHAPVAGERGELLLWRDHSDIAAVPLGASAKHASGEVDEMMQRWGYAQPTH